MIIAVVLAVASLVSPLFLDRQWRLFFAVPVSVFQLYLPGFHDGNYIPPVALLGALALWPEFLHGLRTLLRWRPTLLLMGVLLAYGFSLLWSVDLRMGVRAIIYLWAFLAIFSAVLLQLKKEEEKVYSLLQVSVLFAIGQAFLVLLFQVTPSMEEQFLRSEFAKLFINPNTLEALFSTGRNNVLDPLKSGGFFVNGNVAGAYLWIMGMVALFLAIAKDRPMMYTLCAIFMFSAHFTGSKAAALLFPVLGTTLLVALTWCSRNRIVYFMRGAIVIFLISAFSWIGYQGVNHASEYSHVVVGGYEADSLEGQGSQESQESQQSLMQESGAALGSRLKIWRYGGEAFLEHPMLGQGFGGWQRGYEEYAESVGLSKDFPPHNTLIYLWSQGGSIALILGVGFMIFVMVCGIQKVLVRRKKESQIAVVLLGAFAWTFIHGMGTNFGLVGEIHMMPVLAAMLAIIYAINSNNYGKQSV